MMLSKYSLTPVTWQVRTSTDALQHTADSTSPQSAKNRGRDENMEDPRLLRHPGDSGWWTSHLEGAVLGAHDSQVPQWPWEKMCHCNVTRFSDRDLAAKFKGRPAGPRRETGNLMWKEQMARVTYMESRNVLLRGTNWTRALEGSFAFVPHLQHPSSRLCSPGRGLSWPNCAQNHDCFYPYHQRRLLRLICSCAPGDLFCAREDTCGVTQMGLT